MFEPVDRLTERTPTQGAEIPAPDVTSTEDVAQIVVPEDATGKAVQDAGFNSPSISLLEERRPDKRVAKALKRQRKPRRTQDTTATETVVAATEVSFDDLTALEEENRQLKMLLAERLRQENSQLQKMLERFEAN